MGRGAAAGENKLGRGSRVLGTCSCAESLCGDSLAVWVTAGVCVWIGQGTFNAGFLWLGGALSGNRRRRCGKLVRRFG